jgi:hypothetical protein
MDKPMRIIAPSCGLHKWTCSASEAVCSRLMPAELRCHSGSCSAEGQLAYAPGRHLLGGAWSVAGKVPD